MVPMSRQLIAAPLALMVSVLALVFAEPPHANANGIVLAIASGAIAGSI